MARRGRPSRIEERPRRRAKLGMLALGALAIAGLAQALAQGSGAGERFVVRSNPYTLGQAPDWLDSRHVVYQEETPDGDRQVFRSTLRGTEKKCLTCGLTGPNQVPVVQPHGNWILFHSWHDHAVRIGSPGFGGIGSDVWVMRRDGSSRTNLTSSGEFHDNFHAYWSPDGRYIVWTALNWNADEGGNGRSDIRVARFDPHGPNGPRLVGEHRVRPPNGHWYETQWWAPDGSGFLYTESVDTSLNHELFFCRLPDPARGACRPQRLTRNPAWDEQAIFTPDMDAIIFMSTRDHAGAFNNWTRLATLLDLPARYDYALVLQVFSDGFLQPVFQQADDLYRIDLDWNSDRTRFHRRGPVRRLTHSGARRLDHPRVRLGPRRPAAALDAGKAAEPDRRADGAARDPRPDRQPAARRRPDQRDPIRHRLRRPREGRQGARRPGLVRRRRRALGADPEDRDRALRRRLAAATLQLVGADVATPTLRARHAPRIGTEAGELATMAPRVERGAVPPQRHRLHRATVLRRRP